MDSNHVASMEDTGDDTVQSIEYRVAGSSIG